MGKSKKAKKAAAKKKQAEQQAAGGEMAQDGQQKFDQALADSKRAAYEKFDTSLLYWWGHELVEWKLDVTQAGNRETVLRALLQFKNADAPTNEVEMKDNYEKHTHMKWKGGTAPRMIIKKKKGQASSAVGVSDSDSGSESDSDSDDEEDTEPPNKKQKRGAAGNSNSDQCPYCGDRGVDGIFCTNKPECGLRVDVDFAHEINVHIRLGTGTPGSDNAQTHHTATLTRRDRELLSIATAGPVFPRFALGAACSTGEALAIMQKAYMRITYEQDNKQLQAAIQSGKLTAIGFAVPRKIADIQSGKAGDKFTTHLGLGANAALQATETTAAPPIASLTDFMRAVIGNIIPNLIERPLALMDWCALTSTVIELSQGTHGWTAAQMYLQRALTKCIHERTSFGPYSREAMESILDELNTKPHLGSPGAGRAFDSTGAGAAGGGRFTKKCYAFNNEAGCSDLNCKLLHQCNVHGCTSRAIHTRQTCSFKAPANSGSGARRGSERPATFPNNTHQGTKRSLAVSFSGGRAEGGGGH